MQSMNKIIGIFCAGSYCIFLWLNNSQMKRFSNEPPHDKTNKMACAPSENSDQPGHSPSLIRVFVVPMKKAWIFSYPLSAQWRLESDWVDALSLRWAHMPFCWVCHAAVQIKLQIPHKAMYLKTEILLQLSRTCITKWWLIFWIEVNLFLFCLYQ